MASSTIKGVKTKTVEVIGTVSSGTVGVRADQKMIETGISYNRILSVSCEYCSDSAAAIIFPFLNVYPGTPSDGRLYVNFYRASASGSQTQSDHSVTAKVRIAYI